MSSANLGAVASFYVVGAVIGALGFGWITDRFGRRLVFYVTLIVYLTGVLLSAFAWDFWSFAFFRMITGLGIGGEYAAVNSAIDELIPAKYRGRIDLIVNGSFWLGAAAGALASPFLLDQHLFSGQSRLAAGIRNWGSARTFDLDAPAIRAGKSAMACYSLPQRRSGKDRQDNRGRRRQVYGPHLPPVDGSLEVHPRKVFGIGLILSSMLGTIPRAQHSGAGADGGAVLPVQFRLLHVRPDTRPFLQCAQRTGRLLPSAVGDRQFLRSAVARIALRHRRPQEDDCRNLRHQRHAAC